LFVKRGAGILFVELKWHWLSCRFTCYMLRAVFAELRVIAFAVRLRPCAAGTIEAVLLVHSEQSLQTSPQAHLQERVLESSDDCRNTASHLARLFYLCGFGFYGRLCRLWIVDWDQRI